MFLFQQGPNKQEKRTYQNFKEARLSGFAINPSCVLKPTNIPAK